LGSPKYQTSNKSGYLVRISHRSILILLFIFGMLAIILGIVFPQRYPIAPNDPKSINLTINDEFDTILFELLKLLGGAALIAGSVGAIQEKIQKERDSKEELASNLVKAGLLRVYKSAESREFAHRVESLISGAQYEITVIGLGNSYLAHSGILLRAIRDRLVNQGKVNVNVLFATPQSPALRERIREEHAHSKNAHHFVERGWEHTFFEKVNDELSAGLPQHSLNRLRIERLPFFVMSAVIRIDDTALFQPYGTPLQPGGKCPWIELDMRINHGDLYQFIDEYISASVAKENHNCHQLILIRHGQTIFNEEGRVCGSASNPNLTELGKSQISELAKRLLAKELQLDYIACGTQVRHLDTASLLQESKSAPTYMNAKFNERNLGHFDGMTYAELRRAKNIASDSSEVFQLTTDWSNCSNVESDVQLLERVNAGLNQLPQHGNIAVITSANVILTLLRTVDSAPSEGTPITPGSAVVLKKMSSGKLSFTEII
jgi:broad specificity phosphatase PhoE